MKLKTVVSISHFTQHEMPVKFFSQTIKATPLDQFMTQFWRKRRGVNAHTYAHERLDFYDVSYKTFYK